MALLYLSPTAARWIGRIRARRMRFQKAGGTFDLLRHKLPTYYGEMRLNEHMLFGVIEIDCWQEIPIHAQSIMSAWEALMPRLHKPRSDFSLRIDHETTERLYGDYNLDATNWPGEMVQAVQRVRAQQLDCPSTEIHA